MDFKDYLLNELYDIASELGIEKKIGVAEYRSFKMPENKTDILFVIRYITGSYLGNIKTQPMQIFVYSELDDIQSAYLILDSFAKKHNNYEITIDNSFVKMNFETPVSMRNFIASETGYRASVYCFGTYIEFEDAVVIKKIEFYNADSSAENKYENIPYLTASFNYAAVLNTTKLTGYELNESMKQEAGLSVVITLIDANTAFCNKIKKIKFGKTSGNTDFKFKITFNKTLFDSDLDYVEIITKLESSVLPSSKQSISTLQHTFRC